MKWNEPPTRRLDLLGVIDLVPMESNGMSPKTWWGRLSMCFKGTSSSPGLPMSGIPPREKGKQPHGKDGVIKLKGQGPCCAKKSVGPWSLTRLLHVGHKGGTIPKMRPVFFLIRLCDFRNVCPVTNSWVIWGKVVAAARG